MSSQEAHPLRPDETVEEELSSPKKNALLRRKSRRIQDHEVPRSCYGGINDLKKPQKSAYSVFDEYYTEGAVALVARSRGFEIVTLGIIALNAVWIGYDTDHNKEVMLLDAAPQFVIMENFFCAYFTMEICVRFAAFRDKRRCLRDAWFVFDSCLAVLMVTETWIIAFVGSSGGLSDLTFLRLLRLLRLTRMVRLMRSVPELLTLVKGMKAATRSVATTLGLLILMMYVVAIVFTQQIDSIITEHDGIMEVVLDCWNLGQHENATRAVSDCLAAPRCGWDEAHGLCFASGLTQEEMSVCHWRPELKTCDWGEEEQNWHEDMQTLAGQYSGIARSMLTLFIGATLCDNLTDYSDILRRRAFGLLWVFMGFILLSSFTVLNMLIGVLCEVVSATAKGEQEQGLVTSAKEILTVVFAEIDEDGSNKISRREFEKMREKPGVMDSFVALGVETKHLIALADTLFEPDVDDEIAALENINLETVPATPTTESSIGAARRGGVVGAVKARGKELGFDQFLEAVIHMRPSNFASVLDIHNLRSSIRKGNRILEKCVTRMKETLEPDEPEEEEEEPAAPEELDLAALERVLEETVGPLRDRVMRTRDALEKVLGPAEAKFYPDAVEPD